MKYFTPGLYRRLQDCSSDDAMGAADAAWETAAQRYKRMLRRVRTLFPKGLRSLVEDFYLHDAEVLSMEQEGKTFVIVLRLDTPPRELLVLTYQLLEEAIVNTDALPSRGDLEPVQWMYDEVCAARGKGIGWVHSILLSNGWEIQLRLSNVEVTRAQALYPIPGTILVPISATVMERSA
jgi:hypothetical protein